VIYLMTLQNLVTALPQRELRKQLLKQLNAMV